MNFKEFTERLEEEKIMNALREAGARSSEEISVIIDSRPREDVLGAAQDLFARLNPDTGEEMNSILIFIAPANKEFAVVGGKGVHLKAGDGFWANLADLMSKLMKKGEFTEAIVLAIRQSANILEEFFPRPAGAQNDSEPIVKFP